jgi:phage terminase small subunit
VNGGKGKDAAKKSGSPDSCAHVTASRWLKKPDVQEEIARHRKNIESKLDVTIEKKIERLWSIAESTDEKSRDVISAIDVLNKMQGSYVHHVDVKSDGEKIQGGAVLVLPAEQILKINEEEK